MSARAIVTGALHKAAEIRTSKNQNQFAVFTLRENVNGTTRWWQGIAFAETVIETLKAMAVGEPVSVAGELSAELYAPNGGEPRVNLRVTADAVLTARKPQQKPTPENGNQTFKQRFRERLLPELEDALNEGVSAAASGRETAKRSWASPAPAGGAHFVDEDIPFACEWR
jgi:hypothetical protein